jgi:hypothetical protein
MVTKVNKYCSQGKKSLTDVLINTTSVFGDLEDEEDIDENDENIEDDIETISIGKKYL